MWITHGSTCSCYYCQPKASGGFYQGEGCSSATSSCDYRRRGRFEIGERFFRLLPSSYGLCARQRWRSRAMNEGGLKRYFEFLSRLLPIVIFSQLCTNQKIQDSIRQAVNKGSTNARLLISRINIQIVRCSHHMGEGGRDHGQLCEMGTRSAQRRISLSYEEVTINSRMRNLDRTLVKVRWQAGDECVVFPEDLGEISSSY
jgi:hypothetical protein